MSVNFGTPNRVSRRQLLAQLHTLQKKHDLLYFAMLGLLIDNQGELRVPREYLTSHAPPHTFIDARADDRGDLVIRLARRYADKEQSQALKGANDAGTEHASQQPEPTGQTPAGDAAVPPTGV